MGGQQRGGQPQGWIRQGVQGLRWIRAVRWGASAERGPMSGRRERAERSPATAVGIAQRWRPCSQPPAVALRPLPHPCGWPARCWWGLVGGWTIERGALPLSPSLLGGLTPAIRPPKRGSNIAKLQFYRRDTLRRQLKNPIWMAVFNKSLIINIITNVN